MLVIEVELLHEAVRAAPATDEAVTGVEADAEWPLSPARLFAAFVAADGTGDRCRVTDGTELALLEQAEPPTVHADADENVLHNALRERYVVVDERSKNIVQNYPARIATLVRPGARAHPRTPALTYVYTDVEPTDEQLAALRRRAARIAYVGCADSPARVRVRRRSNAPGADHRWVPGEGSLPLPVPYDGYLAALDHAFDTIQGGGVSRRSWIPDEYVVYGDPDAEVPAATGTLLTVVLDQRVSGHKTLHLTEAFRRAVLGVVGDEAPALLHGHGLSGQGHFQARYLALPYVGTDHADGDIRGLGVWLPLGTAGATIALVRAALVELTELRGRAFGRRGCRPVEAVRDGRLWSVSERRWSATSTGATVWRTATPVIHERHGLVDLDAVQRWFEHAGHPPPGAFRTMRQPFLPGGVRLRPSDLRPRYAEHRFGHYEFTFDESVAGPLVVGRGRQFGLGLLAPLTDRADRGGTL